MEDLNIALLIDSDNVSSRYISGILSELSKYGKITIRRMYGDWSQDRLHSWMKCSSRYSLTPIMQPNNTPGKNASDIGLIIDAMDILYTGDVQGFCIVSSDGDFNKLATRLREAGKIVIGMGEKKTPESNPLYPTQCSPSVSMTSRVVWWNIQPKVSTSVTERNS